jgi:flagellar basal-body rod modification protein FlgD
MNPITPTTSTPASTNATGSTKSTGSGSLLDKNTFLKLMMVQLKNQDPLNPSDPTQYMGELAQLTTLEQTTNIASSSAQSAGEQHTIAALALLGHTVTYTDGSGATISGTVSQVQFTGSGPTLTVNGKTGINPTSVNQVS